MTYCLRNVGIQGEMQRALKRAAKRFVPRIVDIAQRYQARLKVIRCDPNSWMASNMQHLFDDNADQEMLRHIEERLSNTERHGALPLWEGYDKIENYPKAAGPDAKRSSIEVGTNPAIGRFFVALVLRRKPSVVVEFGTAFGASGMYWLAGLDKNGFGHLYTFDPNATWARIAHENLASVSDRFTGIVGTFEDNYSVIDQSKSCIDICLIDAIHTTDFVLSQLSIVLQNSRSQTLIVLDDIKFSDDMWACWKRVSGQDRFSAAIEFGGVGVVEVR
jgi:predicted O-methyltransferase YrrM